MIIKGSREELDLKAALLVEEALGRILSNQEYAVLGVVGGTSVGKIFDILKGRDLPWHRIHLFMIDERLVPLVHEDSNFGMAKKYFEEVFPEANLHPYIYDENRVAESIDTYQKTLQNYGGKFDLVLLSSGEDGHVAALFPEHHSTRSAEPFFVTMEDSPKPPGGRMSSSMSLISKAKVGILLFFGESKLEAYQKFLLGEDVAECPARVIHTIPENYILTDLEAAV